MVIGPTDSTKILRNSKGVEDYENWLEELACICSRYFDKLYFIPDHGSYVDFTKAYIKIVGPEKVAALLPSKHDRIVNNALRIGIKNMEIIEGGSGWTYLNTHFIKSANYGIVLGYSAGSVLELCAYKYLKLYEGHHTDLFIDERAISQRLPVEIEEDLIDLHYFKSVKSLNKLLDLYVK